MLIPSDYKELLSILNKHRVRYLIVGAYAVSYYSEPRYTKDLDIWIEPERTNAQNVYKALREFKAPLKRIAIEDFMNAHLVYQIGIAPIRVDIMMGIPSIDFGYAWKHRRKALFENIRVNIIGIDDLIKSKVKAKRDLDLRDVDMLKLRLKLKRRR